MLLAFLVQDEQDWEDLRRRLAAVQGKAIIHVADKEPISLSRSERPSAVDEVEILDDDDYEDT